VNVHTECLDSSRLTSSVETALYRIMQEALTCFGHPPSRVISAFLECASARCF
jgi:hypothetical protein